MLGKSFSVKSPSGDITLKVSPEGIVPGSGLARYVAPQEQSWSVSGLGYLTWMVEAQGFPTERGQVLGGRTKLWEVGLVGKAPKWGKLKGAKAWEQMSILGQNLRQNLWWSVGERRRNLCSAAPVFTLPLWRNHAVWLLHKKNATEDRHTWVHKMLMPYDRALMCSNNGLGSHCCNSVLQQ